MRGRALALSIVVAGQQILLSGSVTAETSDFASFRSCVDRNVKSVFKENLKAGGELALYGYHTDVANNIISICDPTLPQESVQDSAYTANPRYKYVNGAVEAQSKKSMRDKVNNDIEKQRRQAALDAPRLKAAKDAENDAGDIYYRCLVSHAQILAINSNEPADIIAKASFPSCSGEREAVFAVYHKHGDTFDPEAMDVADKKFEQALLLEIIKVRAVHPSPTPSPTKSDSPT
jgi:hypothetical protein